MFKEPSFWKYLIFNDDGKIIGLSNDAPEEERIEYEKWLEEERKLRKKGIKR